ncbi:MAG: Hsp20/alpha crystallin family protein [Phycisphaerae bacterium]
MNSLRIETASKREDEFGSVMRGMGAWVDHVLGPSIRKFSGAEVWSPAVNLYEDECCYYVVADLAGVDPNQIDLHTEDHMLHMVGRREMPKVASPSGQVRVHLMEVDQGPFRRKVQLPGDANTQAISATYRSGFLSVRIPKK